MDTYVRRAVRGVGNFLGEFQLEAQAKHPKLLEKEYKSYLDVPILDYRPGSYNRPKALED